MREDKLMRRVQGYHDIRMDGMLELLTRCKGKSVMDIGCNRGLVAYEFANNGATVLHGCDNYEDGIRTARHLFCDLRNAESKFEVVDLTKGPSAFAAFGQQQYDIVVMLATYHKLKRIMEPSKLSELMVHIGRRTKEYFGWRGTSDDVAGNEQEIAHLDKDMRTAGLKRVLTSYISIQLGAAAVWSRV